MVGPVVEELENDYEAEAVVGSQCGPQQRHQPAFWHSQHPTILFLKNGEVVDKSVNAVPKNVLQEKLDSLL